MRVARMTRIVVVVFVAASIGCTDAGPGGPIAERGVVDSSVPTSEPSTSIAETTTSSEPVPESTDVVGHSGVRIEIVESRWGSGEGSGRVVFLIRNSDIESWTTVRMRLVDTEMESTLFELAAQRQFDLSILLYIDDGEPIPGRVFAHPHAAGINEPTLMVGYWTAGPGVSEEFVMYLDSGGYEIAGSTLEEVAIAAWSRSIGAEP